MKSAIFTRGKGPYGKVYEKLRKRSLRLRNKVLKRSFSMGDAWYYRTRHNAYVEGVRDALAEVERIGSR